MGGGTWLGGQRDAQTFVIYCAQSKVKWGGGGGEDSVRTHDVNGGGGHGAPRPLHSYGRSVIISVSDSVGRSVGQ